MLLKVRRSKKKDSENSSFVSLDVCFLCVINDVSSTSFLLDSPHCSFFFFFLHSISDVLAFYGDFKDFAMVLLNF